MYYYRGEEVFITNLFSQSFLKYLGFLDHTFPENQSKSRRCRENKTYIFTDLIKIHMLQKNQTTWIKTWLL